MKRQQTGKNNSEKNRNKVKRLILPNFSYQEIIERLTQIIKFQLSRYCVNGKSIGNRSMDQMIEQRKRPKQIQPTDFRKSTDYSMKKIIFTTNGTGTIVCP